MYTLSKLVYLSVYASILTAGQVDAGGCNGCSSGPCGKIINHSGRNLLYTTNPSDNLSARPGRCHFWNWSITDWDKTVSCSQETLGDGQEKGGCRQNVDVDGFTFPSNAYWVYGTRHNAGIWTKITDLQTLTCRKVFGQYICSA